MFGKFLAGAVVMAGAIVAATAITEIKKNDAIKSAGKDFMTGAKNLGKEVCKSAANITKNSMTSINEKLNEISDGSDSENEILSSDNGDITVCAEGILNTDNIQQDKFADADTELDGDEIIDNVPADAEEEK